MRLKTLDYKYTKVDLKKGKGQSKKWQQLLKLPSIALTNMKIERIACPVDFENVVENSPIGEKLFKEFCANLHREYLFCYNLLKMSQKLSFFAEKTDFEKDEFRKNFWIDYSTKFSSIDGFEGTSKQHLDWSNLDEPELFSICESRIRNFLKQKPFTLFLASFYFYRFLQWKYVEKRYISLFSFFREYYNHISISELGEYYFMQSKLTGTNYTARAVDIRQLAIAENHSRLINEIEILKSINDRFIINLCFVELTKEYVVMLYSSVRCGDLKFQIYMSKHKPGLPLERSRFYAAEIICGIEYLHKNQIVHSNLAPENILLDEFGHVKISGLDLAMKQNNMNTVDYNGRILGYTAPEVIKKKIYVFASDWFTFGCILYEMIAGRHPFFDFKEKLTHDDVNWRICHQIESYDNEKFNLDAKCLCSKLLLKKLRFRACGSNFSEIIMKDLFFVNMKWEHLKNGVINPDFVPKYGVKRCILNKDKILIDKKKKHSEIFLPEIKLGVMSKLWQKEIAGSNCFTILNDLENATDLAIQKYRQQLNEKQKKKDAE